MKAWMRKNTESSPQDLFSLTGSLKGKKGKGKDFNEFKDKTLDKDKSSEKDKTPAKGNKKFFNNLKIGKKQDERKLEMEALHLNYEEFLKQEENLSGVLNTKTLSLKNKELRDKIHYWKETKDYRELNQQKIDDKEKQVDMVINKYCEEMNVDKQFIEDVKEDFKELMQDRSKYSIDEQILNDFLLLLDDFKLLEIRDLVT